MTQLSIEGVPVQKRELSQWFTPPQLAERIVEWALQPFGELWQRSAEVLEPSAGRGALVKPLVARGIDVTAIDIDPENVRALQALACKPLCANFLEVDIDGSEPYDLVITNPPFEDGQAEQHIMHALKHFAPRVVAHVPLTTLEGQERRRTLWQHVQLNRLAVCASRAKYGADSGATAMCTIDVSLRAMRDCRWVAVDVEVWP